MTSSKAIALVSFLAMLTIFGVDLADGSQVWSQALYVFPICAIALFCDRLAWVVFGVLLALVFQLLTFAAYQISGLLVVANSAIALATGTLVAALARVARSRFASVASAATTDFLTGLNNRRGFEVIAEREITRQHRYGGVFSLVALDLDRFKSLNDSQGHDAGDRALRLLAAVLQESVRQADSIGRLGGDEFVILMPQTQETECAHLCQQLSATIAHRMDAAGFAVTASIGHTTYERPPHSVAIGLQEADEAMYAAKANASPLGAAVSNTRLRQLPARTTEFSEL